MLRLFVFGAIFLSGCAPLHYARTDVGSLEGAVVVEWIEEDRFVFRPVSERPFRFIRADGETVIQPGTMITDGGSIPRSLWGIRNYSPWGYAPAFMVHDWLFEMHHCGVEEYRHYTVAEAAWIMTEAMKTMIEEKGGPGPGEKFVVYSMFEAVRSPVAVGLWERGECRQADIPDATPFGLDRPGRIQYLLDFDEAQPE
jgi:Protein of unknown function (DUF1353)